MVSEQIESVTYNNDKGNGDLSPFLDVLENHQTQLRLLTQAASLIHTRMRVVEERLAKIESRLNDQEKSS